MRYFTLIDRITAISDESLTAERSLTLAEDYLADHFPSRPVMPGVFLLEAMVQSAGWLLRVKTDFSFPIFLLKEVRNVRYSRFLEPGEKMTVQVKLLKEKDGEYRFEGRDTVAGEVIASARFTISSKKSSDLHPAGDESLDRRINEKMKRRFTMLRREGAEQKTPSASQG